MDGAGLSTASFTERFNGGNTLAWTGNPDDGQQLNYYFADRSFIRMMGLQFMAGENFPENDLPGEQYLILNQQAVHTLGMGDYRKVPGQLISLNDSTRLMVKGVIRDFNYENPGMPVRPLMLRMRRDAYTELYIASHSKADRLLPEKVNAALKAINPSQQFETVWLDEELAKGNSQAATISLLGYLAFMAMAIATLGLLGLVMYTVEVRRKEISIRKIVGARETQLVKILSKGFIWLLLISGLIAVPIGYTTSVLFLRNFAIRTPFGPGWPLTCFAVLMLIGLLTVVSQTFKAAIQNPADQLRVD